MGNPRIGKTTTKAPSEPLGNSQALAGLLLVDKPRGITSHQVVSRVRRLASTRRVGHGGTLDPAATGVLVVAVGEATKLLTYVSADTKEYSATIRLGVSTVTDDAEGEVGQTADASHIALDQVEGAIGSLTGAISQVPSSVSAIKVNGKRAYALVREGKEVQLKARKVTVSKFAIKGELRRGTLEGASRTTGFLDVDVEVEVSSGTYIRALARDLGQMLGVGGHLTRLERTRVGPWTLGQCHSLPSLAETVEGGRALPLTNLDQATRDLLPVLTLEGRAARSFMHGAPPSADSVQAVSEPKYEGVNPSVLGVADAASGRVLGLVEQVREPAGSAARFKTLRVFANG